MTRFGATEIAAEHNPALARRLTFAFAVLTFVISLFFYLKPEVDIALSERFFTPVECGKVRILWGSNPEGVRCGEFVAEFSPVWRFIRETLKNAPLLVGMMSLVWLVWPLLSRQKKNAKELFAPCVTVSSLIIGPLAVVNLAKEISGRSRPIHSLEFGGFEPFTAIGDFSGKCVGNCSFLSGEASAAFWLLVFVPFLPFAWRWPVGVLLSLLAVLTAVLRVAFGRHYVSDVSISALVSLLSISLAWWFFTSARGRSLLARLGSNRDGLT